MKTLITLISDWRLRDPYVALFKGQLLRVLPDAQIIDITHHINAFDTAQTAMVMRQTYQHFPEGTIHILLTNITNALTEEVVIVKHNQHYFLGLDNGTFSMMFEHDGLKLQGRKSLNDPKTCTITKLINMVLHITQGNVESYTTEHTHFQRAILAEAYHLESARLIEGKIIYIDANCNAITNISTQMFLQATHKENFEAVIETVTNWKINKYFDSYVKTDQLFLTSNALGFIEIALYRGAVAILASLNPEDKVSIRY